MSTILFFRGFNTFKDDDLRFGPINFGLAHQHLEPEFTRLGFRFFPLPDIGRGEPQTQIINAHKYLLDLSLKYKISGPLHFLGHSAGGVIARGLAHALEAAPLPNLHVKSITSIASPHRGTQLAERIANNDLQWPILQKLLNLGIYQLEEKRNQFSPWTPERVTQFNLQYPDLSHIQYASIVSGTTPQQLPVALQIVHKAIYEKGRITDGIVEIESQAWGKILGEYKLDHGASLGVRTHMMPGRHKQYQKDFSDMLSRIISHIQSLQ